MQEHLLNLFDRQNKLEEPDRELLLEYWDEKPLLLKAKADLLLPNQIERKLYFVAKGCLRIYFPDDHGNEICVGFGYPNTILSAFPSFLQEIPSEFGIQTLSKTQLLPISRTNFYDLKSRSKAIYEAWQFFLEEAVVGLIERESAMLIQDPRLRLQKLLKRSPHIFQLIPQKYIASYLRMQPETLSRIYKQLQKS